MYWICRALTSYLRQPEVLQTPGLFINRADHMSLEVAAESKIIRCGGRVLSYSFAITQACPQNICIVCKLGQRASQHQRLL